MPSTDPPTSPDNKDNDDTITSRADMMPNVVSRFRSQILTTEYDAAKR